MSEKNYKVEKVDGFHVDPIVIETLSKIVAVRQAKNFRNEMPESTLPDEILNKICLAAVRISMEKVIVTNNQIIFEYDLEDPQASELMNLMLDMMKEDLEEQNAVH